jgi:uncharacterized protein (UPF0254 family)
MSAKDLAWTMSVTVQSPDKKVILAPCSDRTIPTISAIESLISAEPIDPDVSSTTHTFGTGAR